MQAYVDGSFGRGVVSWGAVVIDGEQEIAALSGVVGNPEYREHRQVGGELFAVLHVLDWCKEHGYKNITICYDYIGIEAWATGRWKANKELTRSYAATVRASGITITWNKVKAHSGVFWNERADQLAAEAGRSAKTQGVEKSKDDVKALREQRHGEMPDYAWVFTEELCRQGFQAVPAGMLNEYAARVELFREGRRVATIDIYDTVKKGRFLDVRGSLQPLEKNIIDDVWKRCTIKTCE